jgi:hypothetical protein
LLLFPIIIVDFSPNIEDVCSDNVPISIHRYGLLKTEREVEYSIKLLPTNEELREELRYDTIYLYMEDNKIYAKLREKKSVIPIVKSAIEIGAKLFNKITEAFLNNSGTISTEDGKIIEDYVSSKLHSHEANELCKQDYTFVHLSFQEYLTARLLKKELMLDLKEDYPNKEEAKQKAIKAAAIHGQRFRWLSAK